MRYKCLRDCYTGERFYYGGETYNLPDDMVKSEKNFKLVEGQVVVEPPPDTPESNSSPVKEEVSIILPIVEPVEVNMPHPKRKGKKKK